MFNLKRLLIIVFATVFLRAIHTSPLIAQTANVQIIHNAPDPTVDTVDIFVNGSEFLSDVAFREATAFTEVNAGVDLDIQIAPKDAGIGAAEGPFTFNLSDGDNVVLVADGVLDPTDFSGTASAGFSLEAFLSAKSQADDASTVEVNVHHGSPDAPNVDIFTKQTGDDNPAITDLAYKDFDGYVPLNPENETVGIAGTGGEVQVAFGAPLANLSGQAITVLASGFFDEANANDSNGFGLLAVLPDGTTIPLSEASANLQIIHNAPDPAVETVDIFVNGSEFLSDVAFREATAFTEVDAGVDLDIQIAPAGAGIDNAVGPITFNLSDDDNVVLVADGVVDPNDFSGAAGFSLEAFPSAKTQADDASTVEVNVHHGSPDAPNVDIFTKQTGDEDPAIENLGYPDFNGYVPLDPENETVGIAGAGGEVLVAFGAPLANLSGQAITVLASGFFDEANANDSNGFGLLAVLPNGTTIPLSEASANVQIIHNAPDPAVDTVDIFVNEAEFLTDVAFRSATAFTEVDAGVDLDIQIAPAGAGIENAVDPFTFNLSDGDTVVVVADGVLDPTGFSGTASAGFSLETFPAKTVADDASKVDVNVHHGSPDAPNFDIFTKQTGDEDPAIENLAYPDFTGYVPLSPENETVGIAGTGGEVLVAFGAPLANLSGQAITVLASGFFDADNANDSNGFGLLAVLPNGTTIPLSEASANVQIIHNAPDPAVETVDIFVNGSEFVPDVAFREATGFTEVRAGVDLDIQIAPDDAGIENAEGPFTFNLSDDDTVVVVADGVVDPSSFSGTETAGFSLETFPAKTVADDASKVDVNVHHGSPDAPNVDIFTKQTGDDNPAITDLAYKDFNGYVPLDPENETVGIAGTGGEVLVAFGAPLANLQGQALTVLASGFFDADNANDSNGFGLLAVLPNGTTIPLSEASANVQIIHNAPDPAVETVDIFVNEAEFLTDVAFRSATAFTEMDAGVDLDIQIAPAGAGIENAVDPITFNLSDADNVVLVADGVVDPSTFSGTTPAGFSLEAFPAKTVADDDSKVEVNVHHGSPDAPNVDIFTNQTGENAAVENLGYPEFTGYVELDPVNETIEIAETNNTGKFEFSAPLADLEASGLALTVLASGFFDEANASDANGFGLLAVLPDGTTIPLDGERTATDGPDDGFASELPENFQLNQNFPNPFNPSTTIQYALPEAAEVQITLFDMLGRQVSVLVNERKSAGSHSLSLDMSNFSSGVYLYRMDAGSQSFTRKLTLIK